MLSEIFFPQNTYTTPTKQKKGLLDKLMLNSRWAFYIKFFRRVMNSRRKAINNEYDDASWSHSSLQVLRVIEGSGGHFDIEGLDNIAKEKGPIVFIGNHMSTVETMVLPCMIAPYMKTTFVVKEDLANHTFFGPIMRSRNPITLGRQEPRKDMMKLLNDGKNRLDNGCSIIIFPEGTRQKYFDPKKLNSLGIKLAQKSGVKVIPVAIKTDFWGVNTYSKVHRNKKIYFNFGEAIDVSKDPKAAHQQVLNFIEKNLKKWFNKEKSKN